MATIYLETLINASAEICFDLSRSIDLHLLSTKKTNEKVVAGKATGLMNEGEVVTWEATHFFVRQNLTVRITKMNRPHAFVDEMVKGAFKSIHHTHEFKSNGQETIMIDIFKYEVPLGFAGILFDKFVLKKYMTRFLKERNEVIRDLAVSGKWKQLIKSL